MRTSSARSASCSTASSCGNTIDTNAALDQLRATGRPVLDADVVRLSPFVRRHLGVHGAYAFLLPELAGNLRELRDPHSDAAEED